MMTNLNEYLMSHRDVNDHDVQRDYSFPRAPRITCKDGFSLSVQASHGAYCLPRRNIGEWYCVEVGYPSAKPEFFHHMAEGLFDYESEQPKPDFDYCGTVYGYVPIELVEQCIDLHGGIASTPDNTG